MVDRGPVNGILYAYHSGGNSHEACVPNEQKNRGGGVLQPAGKVWTTWDDLRIDQVAEHKIRRYGYRKEKEAVEKWQQNWGFVSQFDQYGNEVDPPDLPDSEVSRFSENVPNTNSATYGSRNDSEVAKAIQSLEFRLNATTRRKKPDKEFVQY